MVLQVQKMCFVVFIAWENSMEIKWQLIVKQNKNRLLLRILSEQENEENLENGLMFFDSEN